MSAVLVVILVTAPLIGGLCFCLGFCAGSAWVSKQHLEKYDVKNHSHPEPKIHPTPLPASIPVKINRMATRPLRDQTPPPARSAPPAQSVQSIGGQTAVAVKKKKKLVATRPPTDQRSSQAVSFAYPPADGYEAYADSSANYDRALNV